MKIKLPARGLRMNRLGYFLAAGAVAIILGGFFLMNYLSWTKDKTEIAKSEEKKHRKSKQNYDEFMAPREKEPKPRQDADIPMPDIPDPGKQNKPEPKEPKEPKNTSNQKEELPHVRAKRDAAYDAWKEYYKTLGLLEKQRVDSAFSGMTSLWSERRGAAAGGGNDEGGPVARGPAVAVPASTGRFSASGDKVEWANRAGQGDANYIAGMRTGMASPYQVMESTFIPARTQDGIFSGLPIGVRATVTRNVPCAVPGGMSAETCIPIGTTVIIDYNTTYKQGECVVQASAKRFIYPDNSSQDLENMPIGNAQGYAGMKDECDTHLGERLLNAVLFSMIDNATTLGAAALGADQVQVNTGPVERVAQGDARDGMNIPPTHRIRPGYDFGIRPHKDMIFDGPFEPIVTVQE